MMKIQDAIQSNKDIVFLDRSLGTDKNVFEKSKENIKKFIYDYHDTIICDKTMGTAGWLVKFYNNFKKQHCNILLHGCEVDDATYKLSPLENE